MKKKLATLLLTIFSCTLVAVGCNAGTNNSSSASRDSQNSSVQSSENLDNSSSTSQDSQNSTVQSSEDLDNSSSASQDSQNSSVQDSETSESGLEDSSDSSSESTELHQHAFATNYDESKHWKECECGEVDLSSKVAHAMVANKNDTYHWEECDCGYKTTEVAHTLTVNKNETYHWEECDCGYKTTDATHTGGTATCISAAECTACGTLYGELGKHAWEVIEENMKSQCATCQAVSEKITELVYVEGENGTINLAYDLFAVGDEYTVTVQNTAKEIVVSKTVTVSDAGKLSFDVGALPLGKKYTIICEKEKVSLGYSNVMAVTSVIYDMEDFAALFTSAENSTYYTAGASGYYVLANDIDASGYTHTHSKVDRWNSGLTGTFDGMNHTIDGLTVGHGGLFSYIKGGMVKDLSLTNLKLTGSEAYGIAAYINTATIQNVFIQVTQLTMTAWNQAAIAYRADNSNALIDVTVEMLESDATAFAIGGSSSMTVCKCANVYVVSNNGLITDATAPQGITQVTWTLEAAEKQIYTINKDEYSNTTTYTAVFNKGVEAQAVVWKSSDETVATVDNGVVTAVAEGMTTISVEYTDSVLNKTYTFVLAELVVSVPVITITTNVEIAVGVAEENRLVVADIAPDDSEFVIASIVDNNGVAIGYDNGVVTVPSSVEVGREYTWSVSNGAYAYTIKAFVATNVIREASDLGQLFNYSAGEDYFTVGTSKDAYYVLGGNIDATGYTQTHGKVDSSGQGFKGTFDGRGYAIDGITFENAGLFGFVQGGTIKNVALTNVKMQGTNKTEVYVITKQSNGMTIDNVFVSVEYNAAPWNQGLFEKAWGNVSISNMMVVATGGNANTFAVGAMYNNETRYTYTNVYVISALAPVRVGSSTGITIHADVDTFKANVTTSNLNNFNEYWDLTGAYPVFKN